jgi:hypothetical protein
MFYAADFFSQSILFPQEYFFEQYKNQKNYTAFSNDTCIHTSIFPVINQNTLSYDSLNYYESGRNWFERKFLQDNFISMNKKDTLAGEVNDFKLAIDPILNLNAGVARAINEIRATYTNTRGVIANLQINKRFKIETAFIENQSVFPVYISADVNSSLDVLGQGRWKTFKKKGYDYAMSSGVVWLQVSKKMELYLGHGKQKVGNGYRSFLLSDQAFNYPYTRIDISSKRKKIKYTATYAVLMNLKPTVDNTVNRPEGTEPLIQKKPFSYQYLSYQPSKYFSLGLFQGIVWKPGDEKNRLDVSPNFLNPVIFSNLATYGFNSSPEINVGVESNLKITKNTQFYWQLASDGKTDSVRRNRSFGLQVGLKLYNAFTLKNLFLQAEYNVYGGKIYQNTTLIGTQYLYTHYSQNLAYRTSASDGKEIIGMAAYKYKRFLITAKAIVFPKEDSERSGTFAEGKFSFILQPKTNMNISAGCVLKDVHKKDNTLKGNPNRTQWIYLSFATSLFNSYYDF